MRFEEGETALIVGVPEAEPLVRRWRQREIGVPAHVTVLAPFLHVSRIDEGTHGELRALFARHSAFEVSFRRVGRFPEVVYLVPEPEAAFVNLTQAVVARWPETPPYRGTFAEIVPHLTVALGSGLDEAKIAGGLPLTATAAAVSLMVCDDGEHWSEVAEFRLAS
ncbi:2'-5' RNA ligase family protein [Nonomuraea turkmeniaca]|nr:2'-5' RNA ligase family protein [Nonomuraea turkmeniaca]